MTAVSDEGSKIVELQIPDADDVSITRSPQRYIDRCEHLRVEVDDERRTLTCRNSTCKAVLDPIAWLVQWASRKELRDRKAERMEKLARENVVHAPGPDGRRTLCGAGSDANLTGWGRGQKSGWTVTVSNKRHAIGCKRCRQFIGATEPGKLG